MSKSKRPDPKVEALRKERALNRTPDEVNDPLFSSDSFFDARDLVQVKYEMLRRVRTDGHPITQASKAFGFSRPAFYQAQSAFQTEGLPGLLPRKRGPRGRHKITGPVLEFILQEREKDPSVRSPALAQLVEERFGLRVHPRSIERVLTPREKKVR